MRAIIIGAGGTTRALLHRLGSGWDVTLVDIDADALSNATTLRACETYEGDGSSLVVLNRAGLAGADALIAATDDDDVNLEAARHAQTAGLFRVAAVAADADRLEDYRAINVPAFSPDSITARNLEVHLEPRRVSSTAFAQGRAEAIEFRISPDSPVVDKALHELHSASWLVAAILRGDDLIVPHGGTRLEPDDLVTVVGASADFARIVQTFAAGEARFPLSFGKRIVVLLGGADDAALIAEAAHLVRNSRAEGMVLVSRDSAESDEGAFRDLTEGIEVTFRNAAGSSLAGFAKAVSDESVGVVVAAAPTGTGLRARVQLARLFRLASEVGVPLLIARGSHPIRTIVVPGRRSPAGEAAGRAAIDLARIAGARLTGVAVVAPRFLAAEPAASAQEGLAWLREEAAVQGVPVRRRIRNGNQVRVIADLAERGDLLVVGTTEWPRSAITPGSVGHLALRSGTSVLVVPAARR